MKRHTRELSVAAVLALLLVVLAVLAPAFFSPQPLRSLLVREMPALVVACGMALVIIAREIDISVGSQFSVCSVVAGLLAARGWPLPLVLLAALGTGALLGLANGALVALARLPSIVVTLATMVTLRQGLNLARQGEFVNLPDGVQWFGLSQTAGQWIILALALALLAGLAWAARRLAAGRFI
jgi:rhamnose transport system permease protein